MLITVLGAENRKLNNMITIMEEFLVSWRRQIDTT